MYTTYNGGGTPVAVANSECITFQAKVMCLFVCDMISDSFVVILSILMDVLLTQ